MKHLFIVRHAKSSWKDLSLTDFERPLNKRGKHDAPFMGEILKKRGLVPDLILSSPAKRAKKTAIKLAKQLNYDKNEILFQKKIYDASESSLLTLIKKQNAAYNSIFLIGHNPELTSFSNILCDKYIYNIPTTGIVHIQFDINQWKEVREKSGIFRSFLYPKLFYETEKSNQELRC